MVLRIAGMYMNVGKTARVFCYSSLRRQVKESYYPVLHNSLPFLAHVFLSSFF